MQFRAVATVRATWPSPQAQICASCPLSTQLTFLPVQILHVDSPVMICGRQPVRELTVPFLRRSQQVLSASPSRPPPRAPPHRMRRSVLLKDTQVSRPSTTLVSLRPPPAPDSHSRASVRLECLRPPSLITRICFFYTPKLCVIDTLPLLCAVMESLASVRRKRATGSRLDSFGTRRSLRNDMCHGAGARYRTR